MTSTSVSPDRCNRGEQRADLLAGRAVERSGRLVGEQESGPVHERTRDRYPLPLAAREPRRIGVAGALDTQRLEQFVRTRARLGRPHPAELRGQKDVVGDSQIVEQVEELEDHPDPAAAEQRRACFPEPVDPRAGDGQPAARRPVEPGDQIEQRRLAAARRAHDRDRLARPDLEADAGRARPCRRRHSSL